MFPVLDPLTWVAIIFFSLLTSSVSVGFFWRRRREKKLIAEGLELPQDKESEVPPSDAVKVETPGRRKTPLRSKSWEETLQSLKNEPNKLDQYWIVDIFVQESPENHQFLVNEMYRRGWERMGDEARSRHHRSCYRSSICL